MPTLDDPLRPGTPLDPRAYRGAIYTVLRRHYPHYVYDEDVWQDAYVAVLLARTKFDPTRGLNFLSWVFLYVRYYLYSRVDARRHVGKFWPKDGRIRRRPLLKLARRRESPSMEEIREAIGHPAKYMTDYACSILLAACLPARELSLDAPVSSTGTAPSEVETLHDRVPDEAEEERRGAFDEAIDANRLVSRFVRTLSPREARIAMQHLFDVEETGDTLEVLGQRYGVTRERVRQIEAAILRKFTKELSAAETP